MAVTDEAIEKIKGMIVSGALRPGARLPKESELAAGLGLSRNSLREAVRALSLIRILDVRQGEPEQPEHQADRDGAGGEQDDHRRQQAEAEL